MSTGVSERRIMRRGFRLLWASVRAQPKPFAVSLAACIGLMAVAHRITGRAPV